MFSFKQFLKESSADFEPALANFQAQVLASPTYYTHYAGGITSSKLISAVEARQVITSGSTDPEIVADLFPMKLFNDELYVYVYFMRGTYGFIASVDRHNGNIVMGRGMFSHHDNNIFSGFRWQQKRGEKNFKDVTLYLAGGMGNIIRTDCRAVTVQVGKYAQYTHAINVQFLPKGKSKPRKMWIADSSPFCVIVPMSKALQPDDIFGSEEPGSVDGVTVKRGRYSAFDPRWESDFLEQLKAKHVPVLWSHEDAKSN